MGDLGGPVLVERHSTDFIPHEDRHGKPSDLLFVWFGANMELPVVAAGATTVISGLGLAWAVLAIVVGVAVGTLFMALHSAQGPHLGLPQMIQSRAQFGYYGAALPLVFVVVMYLGFYAAGAVLGAQALVAMLHIPLPAGIVILSVLSMAVAIFGYDLIHRFERYLSYLVAVVFAVLTVTLLAGGHATGPEPVTGHGFLLGPFLLAVSVSATSQLGFAPYVADYSRYLPARTSIASVFWYTYAGVGISGVWLMSFGAVLARDGFSDLVGGISSVAGGIGGWFVTLVLAALVLGVLSINALNIYGGYMSSLTFVSTFRRRWRRHGVAPRLWFIVPVAVLATVMSFLYKDNLLSSFEQFLVMVLALMIPWTSINLVDYYFVRRGRYQVQDMDQPRGYYGRINVPGVVAYVVGFLVQIPFMHNSVYTGPVATALHDGDISWVVGAVLSGLTYLIAMRIRPADPVPTTEPLPATGQRGR
ncbi:cytosine permease [Amycolatopsis acidiphila]|uniref:Cytosine permease n=1 Tax=Amycolatopsis acidiphila TaxID=715473 RepID=A0A558AC92_9PSEU|nr:cytosine permease [Amycolatopsis acidiphila]TVT21889.1 cytosine permease [Amycolatopsis acidiphila]UIJ57306.1 cytosine permease [Amycolatopsis acidiphila]GHG84917.1 putative purine-cytosine permease YxlA [Amycolatopsis acidiphila]